MFARLNGWQRLGVVVSILWILIAGFFQRSADIERAENSASVTYRACADLRSQHNDFDFNPCMRDATKDYLLFMDGSWANVAFVALAPIPAGWLAAYVLLGVAKWIRRGFSG